MTKSRKSKGFTYDEVIQTFLPTKQNAGFNFTGTPFEIGEKISEAALRKLQQSLSPTTKPGINGKALNS